MTGLLSVPPTGVSPKKMGQIVDPGVGRHKDQVLAFVEY